MNHYNKISNAFIYIRGLIYNYLYFGGKLRNLKISSNVEIWGNLMFGNNVFLGKYVKLFRNVILSDNSYLGDFVEIRGGVNDNVSIGQYTTINKGTILIGNVKIGENALIAPYCVIVGSNHSFSDINKNINEQGFTSKGIIIGSNVWIGANSVILDGVEIEDGVIIGAGSVVTKSVLRNSIIVGNPSRILRTRI